MRAQAKKLMRKTIRTPDPTRLEIFKNIFHSIAEEMGAVLRRSAFSPNIKERRGRALRFNPGARGHRVAE
jgi:Hydantoinase B/oxoprolinase